MAWAGSVMASCPGRTAAVPRETPPRAASPERRSGQPCRRIRPAAARSRGQRSASPSGSSTSVPQAVARSQPWTRLSVTRKPTITPPGRSPAAWGWMASSTPAPDAASRAARAVPRQEAIGLRPRTEGSTAASHEPPATEYLCDQGLTGDDMGHQRADVPTLTRRGPLPVQVRDRGQALAEERTGRGVRRDRVGVVTRGHGPRGHSHSMVPGGLDVMSYATRLTPSTSLMMRLDIFSRRS